jgi:hypothetical protein
VKVTNVFLTTIFKIGLQPYFRLATSCMTRDILIKHKEAIVICEESGPVITNYNVLITQLESKLVAHPIVTYIISKQ